MRLNAAAGRPDFSQSSSSNAISFASTRGSACLHFPNKPARVVSDSVTEGTRALTLRLTSPRGAANLQVTVEAPGEITSAAVEGEALDNTFLPPGERGILRVAFYGLEPEGALLSLTVASPGPVTITLRDYSDGLPAALGVPPRPVGVMAGPTDFMDPTIVEVTERK